MKHMPNPIKNFDAVKLTEDERNSMRGNIVEYMHEHPVREMQIGRLIHQRSLFGIKLTFIKGMPVVVIIAVLALLGGGTSFAAQGALPGDALYPVKVGVNEQVQGWFAVGTQSKAKFESDLAAKRLEEAEQLVVQGRLSEGNSTEVSDNFKAHANQATQLAAQLKDEQDVAGAAEVSSDLEAALKAHAQILRSLNAPDIADEADFEAHDAEDSRVEMEDNVLSASSSAGFQVAAQEQLDAAMNAVANAQGFFDANKATLGADSAATFSVGLTAAENKIASGKMKLAASEYADAFVDFQNARRIAREAQLLLQAHGELKIGGAHDEHEGDNIDSGGQAESSSSESTSVRSGDENNGAAEYDKKGGDRGDEVRTEGSASSSLEQGTNSENVDAQVQGGSRLRGGDGKENSGDDLHSDDEGEVHVDFKL